MSGIRRSPRKEHFVIVQNRVVRDQRLSYRARGVLVRLLSNADDFSMTAIDLAREGKEGHEAILTALRELRVVGYLTTVRHQVKGGQWVTENFIFDSPEDAAVHNADHAEDGSPDPGKPKSGKPALGRADPASPNAGGPAPKQKSQSVSLTERPESLDGVGRVTSLREVTTEGVTQQKYSSSLTAVDTPGSPQRSKRRHVHPTGVLCWTADDLAFAHQLEAAYGDVTIRRATEILTEAGIDPLPSRVARFLMIEPPRKKGEAGVSSWANGGRDET